MHPWNVVLLGQPLTVTKVNTSTRLACCRKCHELLNRVEVSQVLSHARLVADDMHMLPQHMLHTVKMHNTHMLPVMSCSALYPGRGSQQVWSGCYGRFLTCRALCGEAKGRLHTDCANSAAHTWVMLSRSAWLSANRRLAGAVSC